MSEENKGCFDIKVKCKQCEKEFSISSTAAQSSIAHKKEFKVNGQSIFLTYYDCPHCGERHFVQIDDAESLNALKRVTNEFYKLMKNKKQNKKISKKQLDNFEKIRKDLSIYRTNLMKEYTDKVAIDAVGNGYTLKFLICE